MIHSAYFFATGIAMAASVLALEFAYRRRTLGLTFLGATILGLTIVAMHYTAMLSTTLTSIGEWCQYHERTEPVLGDMAPSSSPLPPS